MQPGVLVELSYAHTRRRDFPSAIGAAEEYLERDPASIPGRLALANALFMGQRLPEARAQTLKILAAEPGNAGALKLKGNSEYLLGDLEQAEQTFIELLEQHPDDAEAAYMLGRIYYEDGRLDYAVGQFQRVLKLDPKNYKAYDNLGLCYEARGEVEMATRHFLTAIKLVETDYPDYDWPYANLANLLLGQGDAEKAFSAAVKAATRNPRSARNCYLAGKALSMLNQTELSIKWLERSASLDAGYAEPLYLLARLYNQTGDEEKARDALRRFREAKARSSGKGR
jgi:tetratricopeptide (TPR) repeat protein